LSVDGQVLSSGIRAIGGVGGEGGRRGQILGLPLCECRDGLGFAVTLLRRDLGGGEGHVSGDEIGVERQSAVKKGDVFLLWGTGIRDGTDGGHERPRALGIFFDRGAAIVFCLLAGTDVNQFRAFGEKLEGTVVLRNAEPGRRCRGGEALDEDAVAASKLDAVKEIGGRRETDAASLDELAEVAGGITLSEAAKNFGPVKRGGLGEDTRVQQSENETEEESTLSHLDVITYSLPQYGKL